jgi:hypothetical protein
MEYATGALPPNHEVRIHVQANGSVLGLWHGQDDWVYPSPRVELLIKLGHLIWLDEPEEGNGT